MCCGVDLTVELMVAPWDTNLFSNLFLYYYNIRIVQVVLSIIFVVVND